jgi:hypothetical protein
MSLLYLASLAISVRCDNETAIESCFDCNSVKADKQEQGGKGDGILPGGRGRSTIFVDTSTVCPSS